MKKTTKKESMEVKVQENNMLSLLPVVEATTNAFQPEDCFLSFIKDDVSAIKMTNMCVSKNIPLDNLEFRIIKSYPHTSAYINRKYVTVLEDHPEGYEACEAIVMLRDPNTGKTILGQLSTRKSTVAVNKINGALQANIAERVASEPQLSMYKGYEYLLNSWTLKLKMKSSQNGYSYLKVDTLDPVAQSPATIQETSEFLSANVSAIKKIMARIQEKITIKDN